MGSAVFAGLSDAVESQATPVCDVVCELPESPVWDERRKEIFWCDIPAGVIHGLAPASGVHRQLQFDGPVGSLGLCDSGRLIVACGMEILIVDPDSGDRVLLHALPEAGFPCRLNDGRVGPDGAFWVGSMHDVAFAEMEPRAHLWRVTRESVRIVASGLKVANGLAFSPDGSRLWRSNSVQRWVKHHPFDPQTGTIGQGTIVCTLDEAEGRPDGAAVDVDGTYWSAGVSAGVLNGLDADGRRVARIPLPVPRPTMACFGGEDFRTFFITNHRVNLSEDQKATCPHAGKLLSLRMKRPGFPSPRFDDRRVE